MKTVILYGHLGKKFGRRHKFDVRNPREAIAALRANFDDFAEYMTTHSEPGYHVVVDNDTQGRDIEGMTWPADKAIKIIPAVAGAGGKFGMIIMGAALIAMSFIIPGSGAMVAMMGEGGAIAAAAAMKHMGIAMLLGGVSQLLIKPPKAQTTEAPENTPSYAFNGPVNTVKQGNPIPLCYGRLIVGSQVVSGGIDTVDIPIGDSIDDSKSGVFGSK